MASEICKHSFVWELKKEPNTRLEESKSFFMKVGNVDVGCYATFSMMKKYSSPPNFSYDLKWRVGKRTPLLHVSEVQVLGDGNVLWSDIKKTNPVRGQLSSQKNLDNAEAVTTFVFKFSFEFVPQKKSSMAMLEEKVLTDVVIVAGKKSFDCHKFMLAKHSQYFEKMLTGPFKEAKEGIVRIEASSTSLK
jgi:hypothetical protein